MSNGEYPMIEILLSIAMMIGLFLGSCSAPIAEPTQPRGRRRKPQPPDNVVDLRKFKKRRAARKTGGNPATA